MDNITHTLFAATLARTPLERAGRGTTAALIIASNAPDIDIVAGEAASYLKWHRGPTHGPIGVLGLALVTAAIVTLAYRLPARLKPRAPGEAVLNGAHPFRADARRNDTRAEAEGVDRANGSDVASFGMLTIVSLVGVVMHVLMDLPTSYGTRVMSPFSWRWFAVDWMPIIDVWLLVALAAGLLFGRVAAEARRRNAVIVLTLMAANYGLRAATHHEALALAPRVLGPTMPPPCGADVVQSSLIDSWPRPPASTPPPLGTTRCLVEIAAIPTFLSPFSWHILARMSNAYEIHDVNLLDARFRAPASRIRRRVLRFPNVWTPAVEKAARTHLGQGYLGFSRFPAARSTVGQGGVTTVRFEDMRFVVPARNGQLQNLFTAIVRIGPDGQILQETLGR